MTDTSATVAPRPPLQLGAFIPLPLGAIRPAGWLLDQLRVQANGMSGSIDEWWPDLGPENIWLGGTEEGWERGPYYLDGLVPLAYLLDDARLKAKTQHWIDAILAFQDETGWIGPAQSPNHQPYDVWPVMIVLKALTQYAEVTSDERVVPFMERFFHFLADHLPGNPLYAWGKYRWAELVLSIDWLYNRNGDATLLDLAALVATQGFDWNAHFDDFRFHRRLRREECDQLDTHVVNNAMALKTGAVWWRQSGRAQDHDAIHQALAMLDRYHGQATGMFSGDEHYAGREPSQGTELCAVVEAMFSLELAMAALGDPRLGDRLERITFNALPATFKPDMWAHQYDQQVNQVLCTVAPRQWTNNFDDSNIFGLEPNFGCCTANYHQGWPKFCSHLWMATPDGGLAAIAYAPCRVATVVGDGYHLVLDVTTEYPFEDHILIRLHLDHDAEFPLRLRIPAWAEGATLDVAGTSSPVAAGSFHEVRRRWQDGDVVELQLPMATVVEERPRDGVAITRGPLLYGLQIGEEWTQIAGELPHGDWEVRPTTAWNYGLVLDAHDPASSLTVEQGTRGTTPFDPAHPPVVMHAVGRRLPQWELVENSAGPLPTSPVTSAEPDEQLTLLPYGCTNLRIAEFPRIA